VFNELAVLDHCFVLVSQIYRADFHEVEYVLLLEVSDESRRYGDGDVF
jgi:hypothetical protein